jgi:D-amino-acid dehydrogenase
MSTASEHPSIIVVGGGIVGLCCALSLLEKGHQVCIIDPSDETRPASYGNAGVISPWSCVPQAMPGVWKKVPYWLLDSKGPVNMQWSYISTVLPWAVRFLRESNPTMAQRNSQAMAGLQRSNINLYRHHLKGTGGENLFQNSWYLHVFREANAVDPESLAMQMREAQNAEMEIVSGGQLHDIEPEISTDYQSALVIKGQARALSPGRLCKVLMEKAQTMGSTVLKQTVQSIHPDGSGGWLVQTEQERLDTKKLILAAGAWSGNLLKPLGVKVPLISERGYHMMFKNPGITLNHSVMDVERAFVVSSMEDGLRTAGTAEFADLDAAENFKRADIFKGLTQALLPKLRADNLSRWMGIRPSFPDSLPCIGEVPDYQNLYVAFGHSHYGLGMAPSTGELLAELINGDKPTIDPSPYSINRFRR